MFKKILIANRGEIAVRILRACNELGIPAAVVFSEADRRALHVRMAKEALPIGPASPGESYLSIERIVQAAHQCGADAVHPGYGFLSENATFARAVAAAGLTFIGPPAEAIELMGDKGRARQQMASSGVPVVPGYDGEDRDGQLRNQASSIGYPLLVKAASGGGGKGMRVVNDPASLDDALAAARREALHAFGDQRLILERYIPKARHIEFQVLADQHGHTVHLFERECSIQRRHQKIIEETPSPYLENDQREKMGAAAVAAARAAGYQNAGTVEFIVNPKAGEFYFLEMNTRLQVEHPVTEMVTGLDLVQWQIRIAAGETLPFTQDDLIQRGHAVECRLYAEDPADNFLPATGPILKFVSPEGPGIRVDSGYSSGDQITIHYDPLVAKIITYAEDRPAANRRMARALKDTILLGTLHNGQFLQDLIASPEFQAGDIYTTWVEEAFGEWKPPQCALPPEALITAALAGRLQPAQAVEDMGFVRDRFSPWQNANGFRPSEGAGSNLVESKSTGGSS